MRKYLALALAACFALAVGMASLATAGEETQTEVAKIKPSKFSKSKYQYLTQINTITTFIDPALGQPKSGERTILDLPKQLKFNTKGTAKCKTDAAGLEAAATTEDAIAVCGKKSLVSDAKGSTAEVTVSQGASEPLIIDIQVSAFNEDGKKLLLFSKPIGDFSVIPASILIGELKKFGKVKGRPAESKKNKKAYKESLDVTIPPLAAGAISFFEVTIPKSAKYIEGKCSSKKMMWQATTFFSDGSSTTDTHSAKCKPKK